MSPGDQWKSQLEMLGSFIRTQRQLARLSLREMAELTLVSNPYLSQVERGLHEPSLRVLKAIARALNLSAETILAQAGLLEDEEERPEQGAGVVEVAIGTDPVLSQEQKEALLGVYRSYVALQRAVADRGVTGEGAADRAASRPSAAPRTRPGRKGVVSTPGSGRDGAEAPDPAQPGASGEVRRRALPGG